jgi:succinate-acetate transporter protein
MDLMNWRGTGGAGVGSASIGIYFFFGGLLMILGSIGEWIVGNTFPFVVFGSFGKYFMLSPMNIYSTLSFPGAFWLGFAATLQPIYSAYGNYAPAGEAASAGLATPAFLNSYAYFFIAMGMMNLLYMILALRTNIVFVGIFAMLIAAFSLLAGSYMQAANGNAIMAYNCQVAGGAFTFVTCILGWYLFFVIMLAALDFPFQLPGKSIGKLLSGLALTFSSW